MIYQTLESLAIVGTVNAAGMVCAAVGWQALRSERSLLAIAMGVCAYISLLLGMLLPYFLTIKA